MPKHLGRPKIEKTQIENQNSGTPLRAPKLTNTNFIIRLYQAQPDGADGDPITKFGIYIQNMRKYWGREGNNQNQLLKVTSSALFSKAAYNNCQEIKGISSPSSNPSQFGSSTSSRLS